MGISSDLFLSLFPSFRFVPPSVPELQTEEEHWLLHPADIHALHPDYHPVLGLLLDQLRCVGRQSGPGYDLRTKYNHAEQRHRCMHTEASFSGAWYGALESVSTLLSQHLHFLISFKHVSDNIV